MNGKTVSLVEKIRLDENTFHDVTVEPTCINFFFGRNGTGKSTLAAAFEGDRHALIPAPGVRLDDCAISVYNRAFVRENFKAYGNLKGVFTLSKENAEIREELDRLAEEREAVAAEGKTAAEERNRKQAELAPLLATLRNACLLKTGEMRGAFKASMKGKSKNPNLTDEVLSGKYSPVAHDFSAIQALYETAFDPNAQSYPLFKKSAAVTGRYDLSGAALLEKPVISSSNTEFAGFMKALNATDWVKNGHAAFVVGHSERKCPFCQQRLPDSFERDIAACFDADYQNDLLALEAFQTAYTSKMRQLLTIFQNNMTSVLPKADTAVYEKRTAQLEAAVTTNIRQIAEKVASPAKVTALLDTDALIADIDAAVDAINGQIRANNDIVRAKRDKQLDCTGMVWERIAFLLKDDVAAYRKRKKEIEDELSRLDTKIAELQNRYRTLSAKINERHARLLDTGEAADGMNARLRDSGFEGFSLREKSGVRGTYEVIRDNGEIAENLSEGERNFIAFLYFFQMVRGGRTEADSGKEKIVVIDDPVSGMDRNALVAVGALVRELIGDCENCIRGNCLSAKGAEYDESGIRQIFVLTHNADFYREITYNTVHRFSSVSFFEIDKSNNLSTVKLCVTEPPAASGQASNYNPVQDSYHALWAAYRELKTPVPLIHVIRRILVAYFLRICGYDGEELADAVLRRIREKTENERDARLNDRIAREMLSDIRRHSGTDGGWFFADGRADAARCKDVFRMIFEVTDQTRHYEMMMRETVFYQTGTEVRQDGFQ